jgi:multidrug efflux pump subunit AcrA (membrane-fusion protein)
VLGLCAAAAAAWALAGKTSSGFTTDLPTALAKRGEFLVTVSCRGDLVAGRSVQITAPLNVPDLRIIWMVGAGSAVKAGDVLLKFDTSTAARQLREKEAEMKQAQASLDQATAEARISVEQDRLDLATQGTAVERARLEVTRKALLSRLEAETSQVDLAPAEQKLKAQQAKLELNEASSKARIASLTSQFNKVKAEAELTQKRIGQMEVRAPSEGVVNFLMNYSQGWVNARPFKVGDGVWPGSAIAEIPDLRSLQLKAKVEEMERGRIESGQTAKIVLDPFPEKPFPAKLASISPLTEQSFEWPPSRNFRAYAEFTELDGRLRPGMNGRLDIVVGRIADAISVPARAIVTRGGKPVVVTVTEKGLRPVGVEIVARNPDEVAVKGLAAGSRVTLAEGEEKSASKGGRK